MRAAILSVLLALAPSADAAFDGHRIEEKVQRELEAGGSLALADRVNDDLSAWVFVASNALRSRQLVSDAARLESEWSDGMNGAFPLAVLARMEGLGAEDSSVADPEPLTKWVRLWVLELRGLLGERAVAAQGLADIDDLALALPVVFFLDQPPPLPSDFAAAWPHFAAQAAFWASRGSCERVNGPSLACMGPALEAAGNSKKALAPQAFARLRLPR